VPLDDLSSPDGNRSLFDQMSDSVACYDREGRYLYLNEASAQAIGRPRAEITGHIIWELFPASIGNSFHTSFERVATTGQSEQFEQFYAPWSRWFVNRMFRSGDRIWVIASDVTQQKVAEDQLRLAHNQTAFLAEASKLLSRSLDYEETLQTIAQLAVPTLADWCGVDTLEPGGNRAILAVAHADPARVALALEVRRRYPSDPNGPSGVAQVLRTGKTLRVANVTEEMLVRIAQDPEHLAMLRAIGFKSVLIVPILAPRGVLGAITFIVSDATRTLGDSEQAMAEGLASRASLAIENARMLRAERAARDQAERVASQTGRLQSVMARLNLTLERHQVAAAIIEAGVEDLRALNGGVWLCDPGTRTLQLLHARGYPADTTPFQMFSIDDPAPVSVAVRTGEPVWLESRADYARRFPTSEATARNADSPPELAVACLPLMFEGTALGVLALAFEGARTFEDSERRFLGILSHYCAQALERAGRFENERGARASAEEREQAVKLQAWVLESMAEGVSLSDLDGTIVYTNPAHDRMFGYGPGELRGKNVDVQVAYAPGERARAFAEVVEHVRSLGTWRGEVDSRRKDGTRFTSRGQITRLDVGGKPHMVCVQTDISKERLREDFERHVVGIVSHDLRSPINAIHVSVGLMLQRGGLNEPQSKALRLVLSASQRMARLIRDFLDFAQSRNGRLKIVRAPIDVHELVRQGVDEVQLSYPGRTATVECTGVAVGNCDRDRLSQIVGNLVGNAFQHSAPDSLIRVRSIGEATQRVVEVHNSGKAIPAEELACLFEPFTRGKASGAQSTGLGLYITRQLIVAHGGTIEVRSVDGEGTSFVVRLPGAD
jgi:PAS domain S-box-containing protein